MAGYVPWQQRHGISEEAREAIIEFNRTMAEQRAFAAANRERIDAEYAALTCPPRTIEGHIAPLRDGDPKRWAELQAEWRAA